MNIRELTAAFFFLLLLTGYSYAQDVWVTNTPSGNNPTHINREGKTIIPDGRIVTPFGKILHVAPHPYGLTLSNDGKIAVTANSGTSPLSISIIKNITGGDPEIMQVPKGYDTDKGILASVFMGLAISPDNKTLYVAGGQENKIFIFDLNDGEKLGFIDCSSNKDGNDYTDGYIGDMIMTKDGSTIYAVDQINFRMIIVDTKNKVVKKSIKVGRYPFGIALSPDEKEVYVANVGLYEYKPITSVDPKDPEGTSLGYPPSGYLTKQSEEGFKNDTADVPGLGKANVPESFSVWTVDLHDENSPKVISKIKTGFLIGQKINGIPAVGGASPNSVVATSKYVFVSNGNNDCISVIDTKKDTVVKNIFLTPEKRMARFRGVIPFGVALSPDNKRLYVAESGINAVAVIDAESFEVIGHIPAGWFPSKLKVTPDGKQLIVANAKGYGSGPNAGPDFDRGPEGSNIGRLMKGTVSIINIPSDEELKKLTEQVIANNFSFEKPDSKEFDWRKNNPVPLYPRERKSPIKYIVFISKENRTYDEVFGQVKKGNGLPELARFGKDVTVINRKRTDSVEHADVMLNHLKLANKFSMSDNFYCNSDHSADGHRWLVNTYPNEWVETSVSASYGGNRDVRDETKSPGALSFVGSTGAIYPEDYNEAGSIWDHLDRNNIDFFNFGFGLELAPGYEEKAFKYTGVRYVVNYPVPKPLYEKSSHIYATFNTGIPDQFRADMFMKEFNNRWMGEGKTMPSLITIILPNDHGAGERPDDGYPFTESYMADNDLALGRVVEFLSHTPYWKNMAIFVTEDDPQGGVDHVDAHRSILMMISPYAKKNYVGHHHYSFGSIFKTFWNILGVPYLNQYDAGASDLADLFTDKPDFTPYNAVAVDKRIFDPKKALTPFDENFNWKAVIDSPIMDDPDDMLENSIEYDKEHNTDQHHDVDDDDDDN